MGNNNAKKCPFNCKECMEEECRLYDEEIERCEFEFIAECFYELIKVVEKNG